MRISDWSSDVCSSDLDLPGEARAVEGPVRTLCEVWQAGTDEAPGPAPGFPRTETGDPNEYVHIWVYENAGDRAKKRAAMQADARPDESRVGTACASSGRILGSPRREKKQKHHS